MDTKTYLVVLQDSLIKKVKILDRLIEYTKEQADRLKENPVNIEGFESLIDDKDNLINELNSLDDGFDKIYKHLQENLSGNSIFYKQDIIDMQNSIKEIVDKSTKLKALEINNKNKVENYFMSRKNEVKNFKVSNQTASNYYKNMADQHQEGQSYFLDKKK